MSTAAGEDFPAGWLTQFRRGVGAGAGVLLLALGLCAVPACLAWLVPGADSVTARAALKATALVVLSGNHGGVLLDGTAVSLTPLFVTVLLGWLLWSAGRRTDTGPGFSGLVVGYAASSGVLAAWAQLGTTRAPVPATIIAATVMALACGGLPPLIGQRWESVTERWQRVLRAGCAIPAVYVGAGAVLSASALLAHLGEAAALQRRIVPGATGLPVALLGVSGTPNASLAAVGYLAGPGFVVGSHTSVSVFSAQRGPLPAFPVLAGLPSGMGMSSLGLVVALAVAVGAGFVASRLTLRADRWLNRLADVALASSVGGLLTAVGVALGSGGVGTGSLREVGASWWQVGLAVSALMLACSALWVGVDRLLALRHRGDVSEADAATTSADEQLVGTR
jgi:hypothetical protein